MPSHPVALELSRPETTSTFDARATLVGVIEDLISLVETQMPSDGTFPFEPLRTRLIQSRMRLRTAHTPEELHSAGLRLVGDVSQTHARIAGHTTSRESELLGVIRLLRDLLEGLRGDARTLRDGINESSQRVENLARMDDVRALRRELTREVGDLRRGLQMHETQETERLAQVSGHIERIEGQMAETGADEDRATHLPRRHGLERRLASLSGSESCTIALLRLDHTGDMVSEHRRAIIDRVILCVAQLLQITFGAQTVVFRVDTQSVAVVLAGQHARTVAQSLRQAQARMAPDYEFQAEGATRTVTFTFSSGVAERQSGEVPAELVHRAETLAAHAASQGRGRMEVASSGLRRLLGL